MLSRRVFLSLVALTAFAAPLAAQMPAVGAPDPSRIVAGTYKIDPLHTQVAWSLNHLGITVYHGLFGGVSGTLDLDPTRPDASKVAIDIPVEGLQTTVPALTTHLKSADFFDVAKYPTATFRSTAVKVSGNHATISGELTLHGVTRPVELEAIFIGAGNNMMSKKLNVGFDATTTIRRSDFGIKFGVPAIGDEVKLEISAAFERAG